MKIRCNREIKNASVGQVMTLLKNVTKINIYTKGTLTPEVLETGDVKGFIMDMVADGGALNVNRNNIVTLSYANKYCTFA